MLTHLHNFSDNGACLSLGHACIWNTTEGQHIWLLVPLTRTDHSHQDVRGRHSLVTLLVNMRNLSLHFDSVRSANIRRFILSRRLSSSTHDIHLLDEKARQYLVYNVLPLAFPLASFASYSAI